MLESHSHGGKAISKCSAESAETEGKLPAVNLEKTSIFDDWLRMNVVKNLLKSVMSCVVVATVYQWYTLHIQMGKWWLHFPGKEHTFQESPQNHQICASVPESLQVQRTDPWGSQK